MKKRCLSILRDKEYVHAKDLSKELSLCVGSVCRIIREIRTGGIGVHTTPKGYILSEFAEKRDDVHFLRRLNGRRASDFISLRASEPEIRHRWTSIEDRADLKHITAPLRADPGVLDTCQQVLLKSAAEI